MSEQRKPLGEDFRPGYVFGEHSARQYAERKGIITILHKVARRDKRSSISKAGWTYWAVPLSRYAGALKMDFERFLEGKAAEAKKSGRVLRILDVGLGSGKQWLEFLQRHGGSVEFHATSLTRTFDPLLKPFVNLCNAAILHKRFDVNYFDVVVTHAGIHHQEMIGLENILHVLKPNGEAVVSTGIGKFKPTIGKPFKEIGVSSKGKLYSFHIRKSG